MFCMSVPSSTCVAGFQLLPVVFVVVVVRSCIFHVRSILLVLIMPMYFFFRDILYFHASRGLLPWIKLNFKTAGLGLEIKFL